ncbi:MAG: beta-lactamase family protein [Acidobacteria bacterium]|nr:beta-lactamase family protein [Acidobacteriota bacterium]
MRRALAIAHILMLATLAVAQTKEADSRSAQVDALMSRWSQGRTPGAAVIIIKDGEVLYRKGYGLANLESGTSISPATPFDIASVAKQFTAMAVMMLVERGKLSYTDSPAKFFPELAPFAQQVSIRHLLNHTSGLPDYSIYWKEGEKLNRDHARHTSEDVLKFLAQQKKLNFAPGEKWEYSNSGYVVLALIVGKVSGQPFPQFLKENIFTPLGMNGTYVYDEAHAQANAAIGYVQKDSSFKQADWNPHNLIYGDGRFMSTVEDLYKWDQALYTEKLVKARTLREAFTSGALNDGTKVNYGFGWGMGKYLGLPFVSHSGGEDGFVAQLLRLPEQKFSVIVLSNFEQLTPAYAIANRITSIYLADKLTRPATFKPEAQDLKSYAGIYKLYDLAIKISFEDGALWLTPPQGKKARLVPSALDEFFAEGSNGETTFGFTRNARGAVTGLALLYQNGVFLQRQQR